MAIPSRLIDPSQLFGVSPIFAPSPLKMGCYPVSKEAYTYEPKNETTKMIKNRILSKKNEGKYFFYNPDSPFICKEKANHQIIWKSIDKISVSILVPTPENRNAENEHVFIANTNHEAFIKYCDELLSKHGHTNPEIKNQIEEIKNRTSVLFNLLAFIKERDNQASILINCGTHGDIYGNTVAEDPDLRETTTATAINSYPDIGADIAIFSMAPLSNNLNDQHGHNPIHPYDPFRSYTRQEANESEGHANHVIYCWCWSFLSKYGSKNDLAFPVSENREIDETSIRCIITNKIAKNPVYFPNCKKPNGQIHFYEKRSIEKIKSRLLKINSKKTDLKFICHHEDCQQIIDANYPININASRRIERIFAIIGASYAIVKAITAFNRLLRITSTEEDEK